MNQKIKDLLLYVGVISIILLLVFRGDEKPIYEVSPIEQIYNNIEGKDSIIVHHEKIVIREKSNAEESRILFDSLFLELERVKNKRDTFQIIQIQDTLINTLNVENYHLRNVIEGQDSIIVAQRYIIDSKDTIISIGQNDLKEVKRQRNISMLINGVLGSVLIFKK
jgi:hypothetical protein